MAGAGPTVRVRSTDRRRRSTTALYAGRSAASGNGYSARWRAAKTPPTGCSSIQPASRFIAAPAAEKGGLGPWHRPHQGGPQHQAPRCLRCERQAPRPVLTPGNVHDCKVAQRCIEAMSSPTGLTAKPCATGWQNSSHRARTARSNTIMDRLHGEHPSALKDWRRIATRFDRNIKNFIAAICRRRHLVAE